MQLTEHNRENSNDSFDDQGRLRPSSILVKQPVIKPKSSCLCPLIVVVVAERQNEEPVDDGSGECKLHDARLVEPISVSTRAAYTDSRRNRWSLALP